MDTDTAKGLIRTAVNKEQRGEWFNTSTISFVWDGSNRFRVRGTDGRETYAFGSFTVVSCLTQGSALPAVVQDCKIDLARSIRAHNRYRGE